MFDLRDERRGNGGRVEPFGGLPRGVVDWGGMGTSTPLKKLGKLLWRGLEIVGTIGTLAWLYDLLRNGGKMLHGLSPGEIGLTILCLIILWWIIGDFFFRKKTQRPDDLLTPVPDFNWSLERVVGYILGETKEGAGKSESQILEMFMKETLSHPGCLMICPRSCGRYWWHWSAESERQ